MNEIAIFEPMMGIQPGSISAHPTIPNQFIMTDYFSPGLIEFDVVETSDGLEMRRIARDGWVYLPAPSTDKVRIFPEIMPGSDAKRVQSVSYGPSDSILVVRNGELDRIWMLLPTGEETTRWRLADRPIRLTGGDNTAYIESIAYSEARSAQLIVVRSRQNGTDAFVECYSNESAYIHVYIGTISYAPKTPWLYGLGNRNQNLYYVTGPENGIAVTRGIYCDRELVTPGVTGHGIAFMDDAALIPSYGFNVGDFGQPGAIVRVPWHMIGDTDPSDV